MGKAVHMGWSAKKGLAIDESGALWQWDRAFFRKPFEPLLPAEPEKIAGQAARIISGGQLPLFIAGEIGALWQYDPAFAVKARAVIGGDYGTSAVRGTEGSQVHMTEEVLFGAAYGEGIVYWTRIDMVFTGSENSELSVTDLYRLTYGKLDSRFSPSGQEQLLRGGLGNP